MPHQETKELAAYLKDIKGENLDGPTIRAANMCIQDFLGVSIAGSQKPEASIWKAYYQESPVMPQASLFQAGFEKMTAEQAASLNAVFGHVMDMDDVHNTSITHLAAVTIPSAFALAQKLHASGLQLIEAITSGYEAGARIGEAINPSSYRYWHTTGVIGAFSSGAAAAKLLNLTLDEFINCLGSAGTQAAGLWEFLSCGAMSKVLHTANANLCGLRAARLAKLGFTGASSILEGERGFIKAMAPEYDLACLTKDFHKGWRITENSFKPYACCRHIHSAGCCIEALMKDLSLSPEQIITITDDTYNTAVLTADNPHPENPYAAKFSIQFCIAAAIILQDLSDSAFTTENLNNPHIQQLMNKVQVRTSSELEEAFRRNPNQWSHRLTILLKNGQTLTKQIDYPLGDFLNPFDQDMADRKFSRLTSELIGEETCSFLLEQLYHLETISDINTLFP